MEVSIVRLNRPLLIRMGRDFYQTVYGFLTKEEIPKEQLPKLDDYVGYLAALNEVSNGGDCFTVACEESGSVPIPFWVDKKGNVHTKQDAWMTRIIRKCRKKINLSYTIIHWDMDEDEYYDYVNEQNLIVDETFFYDLERYQPKGKGPLFEEVSDDELPF